MLLDHWRVHNRHNALDLPALSTSSGARVCGMYLSSHLETWTLDVGHESRDALALNCSSLGLVSWDNCFFLIAVEKPPPQRHAHALGLCLR